MNKKQIFEISNYQWNTGDYRPKTTVEVEYDENGFKVHFASNETNLRRVETKHNTDIYLDSCVEMFVQFLPDTDKRYINFEINPNAAVHCGIGPDRYERKFYEISDIESLNCRAAVRDDGWDVYFEIPLSFIHIEYPDYVHKEGTRIRANFYKCGNKTVHPHWCSWNKVDTPNRDFHRPEFFKEIVL